MKKIALPLSVAAIVLAPMFASAQVFGNIVTIVQQLKVILGLLIPMAFGLAVLYFFYGVAKYILAAGDAEKAKEGKSIMIYGVIAIAVMASIWGLVIWLQQTFGINNTTSAPVPTITNTGNALQ